MKASALIAALLPMGVQAQTAVWSNPNTVPPQPAGRQYAALDYDSARGKTVLFGGTFGSGPATQDTWEWDGTSWSPACAASPCNATVPPARTRTAMAFDLARSRSVLFGGNDGAGGYLQDVWDWDGTTWTQGCTTSTCQATIPAARRGHAMAYDGTRVLVFGGSNAGGSLNDLWAWNGTSWTQLCTTGACPFNVPSARAYAMLAYDSARGVVVLFGGVGSGNTQLNDTWEWNGTRWTAVCTTSPCNTQVPSARSSAGFAFDATAGRSWLFGGWNGTSRDADLWGWNGTAWSQPVVPLAPSARDGAVMAYQSATGRSVVFGGYNQGWLAETWEWSGSAWTQRLPAEPAARYYQGVAYDTARSRMVMFSGENGSDLPDTWEWDGSAWTLGCWPGQCPSPPPRDRFAMTFDPLIGASLVFGGYQHFNGQNLGDLWSWNGAAWTARCAGAPCSVNAPSTRAGSSLAFDSAHGLALLFGGASDAGALDELWAWDGGVWSQLCATAPCNQNIPPPRLYQAMAFDDSRGRAVLFGGNTGAGPTSVLGDTWEWDGSAWTQSCVTGPCGGSLPLARDSHAMTYDSLHKRVVMVGGWGGPLGNLQDAWAWDGTTWTALGDAGFSTRSGLAATFDPNAQAVLVQGGRNSQGPLGELWELSIQFGPDGGTDGGVADGGVSDAGLADGGPSDAGVMDAGPADAGALDAGAGDGGTSDAGRPDGGQDAGPFPAPATFQVGCGCGAASASALGWLCVLLFAFAARRLARN